MKVNIIADFTKNGEDKNEPHIVAGTDDIYLAGQIVKSKLEKEGCIVQTLFVVDGDWTLDQLHDMANYGTGLDSVHTRPLYASKETLEFMEELRNNPAMKEMWQQEINRRMAARK